MSNVLHVDGSATVYRLYGVGSRNALVSRGKPAPNVHARSGSPWPHREPRDFRSATPAVGGARIDVRRGMQIGGASRQATLTAHLFDFGVCSLRLRITAPANLSWPDFSAFGSDVGASAEVGTIVDRQLRALLDRIAPAVEARGRRLPCRKNTSSFESIDSIEWTGPTPTRRRQRRPSV